MSRVFVVHDDTLDRDVVIKVLSPELAATLSVDRFTREIKLAAGLQQANIVPVITAGALENGLPWYMMPFVDGLSLREKMKQDGAFRANEGVRILRDVACALEYAHSRGIIHRDIKPENVLLSSGTAVVTDFGIAKAISASKTSAPGGTLTVVGTSLGTPAYMAPEQAVGDPVDQRADIYAWGVVAYEMLSGAHPFGTRTTAQQLIAAHIAETPAPIIEKRNDIPPALASLVMRALEKSPDNRPQSAHDLRQTLEDSALLGTTPTETVKQTKATKTKGNPADSKFDLDKRLLIGFGTVAILIIAALGVVWFHSMMSAGNATATANADSSITTVAVLPFVNTGGNAQDEYFSDGMTDELARALSKVPQLHVAARTSSYSFKGKSVPVDQIGKALHVAGVIEGTVRRAGDRLRVTAQLTDASNGLVVWSDRFERGSKNVFDVQDDLTSAIVAALTPALRGGSPAKNLAAQSRGTDDPEAYDLYLRGRFNWNKRVGQAVPDAIRDFNAAIARDSNFARAYSGLAASYTILPQYVGARPAERDASHNRAQVAALHALRLDSTLAEPHGVLGNILMTSFKWPEAEREYLTALRLDSTNATIYQWYSLWNLDVGRRRQSYALIKHAHELDPLSLIIDVNLCAIGGMVHDFKNVEQACREGRTVMALGEAMNQLAHGHYDSAAASFKPMTIYSSQGHYAYALAKAGKRAEAEAMLKKLEVDGKAHPLSVSLANLGLGNNDAALLWLDRAVDLREDALGVRIGPLSTDIWDPVRSDPRFGKILEKMGLTAYLKTADK